LENKDGFVAVKNSQLIITDPEGLGRYPRIEAAENIDIYVKGEKQNNEIVVSKDVENEIEFKINNKAKEKQLSLEIAKDRMEANLVIAMTAEQVLQIKDKEAANQIVIETVNKEQNYPRIFKREILNLLNSKQINYGIKHDYITEVINQPGDISGKYLIAEGKRAEAGIDAKLIKSEDFREEEETLFTVIDSIDKGKIICYKEKAIPGKSGINIFSDRIPAPPVNDFELEAGVNVQLTPDKLKAIAMEGGQPKIVKKKGTVQVNIYRQYTINGDIDKYTGSIKYDGDLLVKGNVTDYFDVDIGNDLKVQGNIANAEINTQGNLYVNNNIIASTLYIGNYLDKETVVKLNYITIKIHDLEQAVDEILGEASKRKMNISDFRTGKIIRLLIENKFPDFQELILELYQEIDQKSELKDIFKKIVPYFTNMANLERIQDESIFIELKKNIEQFLDTRINNDDVLSIHTGYIQNSEINIGGSVIINKLGCYNSTIRAKGAIIVKNRDGFLKGGDYQSEEIIYAQMAGTKLGKTYFRIGKHIFIKESLGTLVINSDHDSITIDPEKKNINYQIDDFGQLVVADGLPDLEKYLTEA
jgi:hypothetical protein